MQELLAAQLRKANRRITSQRKLVFEHVHALETHPCAAEVYGAIKGKLPSVSLATVYRNLRTLTSEGLLRELPGQRGVVRFDSNLSDHYHFVCGSCNGLSDLPGHSKELERAFAEKTGMHISGHEIVFRGICNACRGMKP